MVVATGRRLFIVAVAASIHNEIICCSGFSDPLMYGSATIATRPLTRIFLSDDDEASDDLFALYDADGNGKHIYLMTHLHFSIHSKYFLVVLYTCIYQGTSISKSSAQLQRK